ncbi:MAG TPA: integration host factor subunit beta [Burkholderiaceae bacterium]|nr:integration host factor subunit beta [Burkholderiaceae bacterium]
MTRSDLVNQLAERFSQLTHRDTEFAVKTILDAMSDALARGHRIEIRGFGSFSINRRPPRVGRNPRSGEQVIIPEKLVPHFKPGKALREAVDARTPADADVADADTATTTGSSSADAAPSSSVADPVRKAAA